MNKSNLSCVDQITHPPDNTDHSVAKQKVQNHQLVHLQQSSHQPWLPHFLVG